MEYQSICCMCGRRTQPQERIDNHWEQKELEGFIEVTVRSSARLGNIRTLNFCPTCSKKPYSVEQLKTIGNYMDWSY